MFSKERLLKKYRNVKAKNGIVVAIFYVLFFCIRDSLNSLTLGFINSNNNLAGIKNILFIEPLNQGYGDLFFQTALFKYLSHHGYQVSVLARRGHSQLLINNPYIRGVYFWKPYDLFKILRSKFLLVGLGRNTFSETLLMLFSISSKKMILDEDLSLWISTFETKPNTLAWIILVSTMLKIRETSLENFIPEIFFSKIEKDFVDKEQTSLNIGIIYGVTDKQKRLKKMNNLIKYLSKNYPIILLGAGDHLSAQGIKGKNYINKLSYRETLLKIAGCSIILGPEGSLVHVASSLVKKTLVIDPLNNFKKNAHPDLFSRVLVFSGDEDIQMILDSF
ncbi:MAG: hypothetical protein PHF79_00980 [Candidatus Pacebacteria bacterium]|nr:hypothetical protein [Candidatus Paceibacterota bacterium]